MITNMSIDHTNRYEVSNNALYIFVYHDNQAKTSFHNVPQHRHIMQNCDNNFWDVNIDERDIISICLIKTFPQNDAAR